MGQPFNFFNRFDLPCQKVLSMPLFNTKIASLLLHTGDFLSQLAPEALLRLSFKEINLRSIPILLLFI